MEGENARLRADLAHRTSQLHSAVTRIGALKSRMDDLILQNDELLQKQERAQRGKVAARKRRQALKSQVPGTHAHREAMASLLGTQDSMLNLIENLSFLPPGEGGLLGDTPPQHAAAAAAAAAAQANAQIANATRHQPPSPIKPTPATRPHSNPAAAALYLSLKLST